jgi:hypothetical protein
VAEWLKVSVLKAGVPFGTAGSNPAASFMFFAIFFMNKISFLAFSSLHSARDRVVVNKNAYLSGFKLSYLSNRSFLVRGSVFSGTFLLSGSTNLAAVQSFARTNHFGLLGVVVDHHLMSIDMFLLFNTHAVHFFPSHNLRLVFLLTPITSTLIFSFCILKKLWLQSIN